MRVGFTGTRFGMTRKQLREVRKFLRENWQSITEVHHGDCMGADDDFDTLFDVRRLDSMPSKHKIKKVIHPPDNSLDRAFCEIYDGDELRGEKPYLERNHDIVDECDTLVSTPRTLTEVLRSGTWATIRYAKKKQKTVIIIYP